jgi:DtxR family Mn-dependent transcriptional regulator
MAETLSSTALAYLKAIHESGGAEEYVPTRTVAARLGRQVASTAAMVRRLADAGHVDYEPHAVVRLTPSGLAEATRLARRLLLLESFLARTLGLGRDEARAEAEALLHTTSPRLERAVEDFLRESAGRPADAPG